jgi:NADPH:quinone reductase-like Zn-dependent oxidoreductase
LNVTLITLTKLTLRLASVGLYTIQIAAIYGFKVITTCSPKNFDLVKSSGATHVFDYSDSDVANKILEAEPELHYVFDTIGNEKSSVTASQAISTEGGGLCTVRPDKAFTENATRQTTATAVLVWTAFMKEQRYGDIVWPVSSLLGLLRV